MTTEITTELVDQAATQIRAGDLRPVVSAVRTNFPSLSRSETHALIAALESAGVIGEYVRGSDREILPAAEPPAETPEPEADEDPAGEPEDLGDESPVGMSDARRPEDAGERDVENDFDPPVFEPTEREAEVLESDTGACPTCDRALFAGGPANVGEFPLWCDTCREPVELEDIALPGDTETDE